MSGCGLGNAVGKIARDQRDFALSVHRLHVEPGPGHQEASRPRGLLFSDLLASHLGTPHNAPCRPEKGCPKESGGEDSE